MVAWTRCPEELKCLFVCTGVEVGVGLGMGMGKGMGMGMGMGARDKKRGLVGWRRYRALA
jgi:hypothetical protein